MTPEVDSTSKEVEGFQSEETMKIGVSREQNSRINCRQTPQQPERERERVWMRLREREREDKDEEERRKGLVDDGRWKRLTREATDEKGKRIRRSDLDTTSVRFSPLLSHLVNRWQRFLERSLGNKRESNLLQGPNKSEETERARNEPGL